jgi:hypothetical protein
MSIKFNGNIVTNGLILYLDAGNVRSYPKSGTTVFDLSKSKINATLTQSGIYENLKKGVFTLNAVDKYISINSFPALTHPITLSFWFNRLGSGSGVARILDFNGTTDHLEIADSAGDFRYRFRKTDTTLTSWISSGISFTNNIWEYFSFTFGGRYVQLYKNSILIYSYDFGSLIGLDCDTGILKIGCGGATSTEYINANMSAIKIYNRVLTDEEQHINYAILKGRYNN